MPFEIQIKIFRRSTFSLIILFLISTFQSSAQIADFDEEQIEQDFYYNINLYSEAYTAPVISAYALNLSTEWSARSQILEPWSSALGIMANSTFNPGENLMFRFNELPFTDNFSIAGNPNDDELPTVIGGETEKKLIYTAEGQTLLGPVEFANDFPALSGISTPLNATPNLSIYYDIGLPLNFELDTRLFPLLKVKGVTHYQLGIGIQNSILKFFLKEDSPFSLRLGLNFNYSHYNHIPEELFEGKDRRILFFARTGTAFLNLNYKIGDFSLMLSPAFILSQTAFKVNGQYEYRVEDGLLVQEVFRISDPVDLVNRNSNIALKSGITYAYSNRIEMGIYYQFANLQSLSLNMGYRFGSFIK